MSYGEPTRVDRLDGSMLREMYSREVEDGRFLKGSMATEPGSPYGLFRIKLKMKIQSVSVKVMVGDGMGWDHVSVSVVNRPRCPSWEEMSKVRDLFFDPKATVIQIHPSVHDYVNDHPYCLHLWHCQTQQVPTPAPIMVGTGRKF